MSERYRLLMSYDGSDFCGWQIQPNGVSIQQLLQKALQTITHEEPMTAASGRTDAGVHAKGQVIHFDLQKPLINLEKTLHSLNGLLPPAIRVHGLEPCSLNFHARYSASRKTYHYQLHTEAVESPFTRRYRWFVRHHLDRALLEQACKKLEGTHDFRALANENHQGAAAKDSIRTLYRVQASAIEGGLRLEFEGDGFLYKMVRNCVGLLVEIARGLRPLESLDQSLKQGQRQGFGLCAPAHGLCLHQVTYPPAMGPSRFLNF